MTEREPFSGAPIRHPATWSAWKWLEQGDHDKTPEEREYIAEKLRELDAQLHELDEGSAYVV